MGRNDNDPLDLGQSLYYIEEFGPVLRNKYGGNNYISNFMSAEIFISSPPCSSIRKKSKNQISKKSCGFC
tara:strand:- start:305 stop:514 length:210 start_codon:yes stop_codon:yes gene_type:complete